MSHIITVFTNPGVADTPQTSTTRANVSDMDIVRHTLDVDESSFDKSRHVGRLFTVLTRTRNALDEKVSYAVTDSDSINSAADNVSGALEMFYESLSATGAVGAIEVTDAQMSYLNSNPQAMGVFINNAIVNPDSLDWTPEKVSERDDAAEMTTGSAHSLSDAIYEHKEASGYFYADEDYEGFYDDSEDDFDDWEGDEEYPDDYYDDSDDDWEDWEEYPDDDSDEERDDWEDSDSDEDEDETLSDFDDEDDVDYSTWTLEEWLSRRGYNS